METKNTSEMIPILDGKDDLKSRTGWKNRTKFTKEEDKNLSALIEKYGEDNWAKVAESMPVRNCRQCRERWLNYLSPNLNKTKWKVFEDNLLLKKVTEFGKKWVTISKLFKNRTDQMLKNRYNLLMRLNQKSHDDSDNYYDPHYETSKKTKATKKQFLKTLEKTQQPDVQPPQLQPAQQKQIQVEQQQKTLQEKESVVGHKTDDLFDFPKLLNEADFQLIIQGGETSDLFSFSPH